MHRKKLLLADQQIDFLEDLEQLLASDYEIVAKASTGGDMVQLAKQLDPDVIVTDDSITDDDGIEAVSALRVADLRAKVVVITQSDDSRVATEAIGHGVDGCVLKRAAPEEIVIAIEEALDGQCWISPVLKSRIIRQVQGGDVTAETEDEVVASLSTRQRIIIRMIAAGCYAKDIAEAVELSRKSVEYQKYKMMRRLGLRSTADFIRFAERRGLAD